MEHHERCVAHSSTQVEREAIPSTEHWITVLRYRKERVQEGKASSCPCSPLDFCFASLVLEHFAFAVSVEQKLGVVAGILNDEAFLF